MYSIVHLADLHLGGVRLDKQAPDGRNQREVDVSDTFARVIDQVIRVAPDLVLIAGDIFDKSRPRNHALTSAFREIQRLRDELQQTPVVMIAGNHDRPTGVGGVDHSLLPHFADIEGVYVVHEGAERLRFGDLSLLCVPEHVAHQVLLTPDPTARRNVLLLHGEIAGAIPGARQSEHAIQPGHLANGGWDYAALGHYHVTSEVAPRCWYAGAMDYTSSNVWGELQDEAKRGLVGKGFLEVDLDTGSVVRHPIVCTRRWIDLPRIDGTDLSARQIDELVTAHVESADITDAIVRQVVVNVPRDRAHEMTTLRRKAWIERALHITVDVRPPERNALTDGVAASRTRLTLDERLQAALAAHVLPDETPEDRARFLELAGRYQVTALAQLEESLLLPAGVTREAA